MDEQIKDVEVSDEMEAGTYEVYDPEVESFKIPSIVYKAGGTALAVGAAVVYAKRDALKTKFGEFKERRRVRAIERELKKLSKLGYKAEEKTE